jgi:chromosome segregation ATPase
MQDKLNKTYALYDTAKAQVVKFTEMLMSKEVELETSKQKIKSLEEALQRAGEQPAVAQSLAAEGKYSLLQDRIQMLNEALQSKEKAIKDKDTELVALNTAKTALEERLRYQDKEFGNANTLYGNLKTQMMQTNELLSRKEFELIEKNKEVLGLKSDLALLQFEQQAKQQDLADMQERYRRTMDELNRATKLNITLQEDMVSRSRNVATEDEEAKRKAEEMKKQVELLLGK